MTVGRSILEKFDNTTWHSEWMSRWEKFSEKSVQALSSWNRTWEGVESEVDALERRRFWDRVDLFFLGAIEQTNWIEREGERERQEKKYQAQININKIENKIVRMHEKCTSMWHVMIKTSWAQPNPILPAHNHFNKVTIHLKCMK